MYPFFRLKVPLLLYPFRFFDPVRGRWIRARYVAERHVIAERYADWEITGPPEILFGGSATMFNPWAKLAPRPAQVPIKEPPPDKDPPAKEPPRQRAADERAATVGPTSATRD